MTGEPGKRKKHLLLSITLVVSQGSLSWLPAILTQPGSFLPSQPLNNQVFFFIAQVESTKVDFARSVQENPLIC